MKNEEVRESLEFLVRSIYETLVPETSVTKDKVERIIKYIESLERENFGLKTTVRNLRESDYRSRYYAYDDFRHKKKKW